MKNIAITQRLDFIENYKEYRSSLDLRWYNFINKIGFNAYIVPNSKHFNIDNNFKRLHISGVILSGGSFITEYHNNNRRYLSIRDDIEFNLIKYSIKKNIPLIGVCRGMQIINHFFRGGLIKKNNTKKKHELISNTKDYEFPINVNSYHNYVIDKNKLHKNLKILAFDKNNDIEALCHNTKKIIGIMWHPERDSSLNKKNLKFFSEVFK